MGRCKYVISMRGKKLVSGIIKNLRKKARKKYLIMKNVSLNFNKKCSKCFEDIQLLNYQLQEKWRISNLIVMKGFGLTSDNNLE